MTIELYTKVRLTVDFPEYGLHEGDTAIAVEYYPKNGNGEDGYSLEGLPVPIPGYTLEVRASQIAPVKEDEEANRILTA
jgi:hypothetical protein